jgi:uncharacterized protein (TIGR03032 family)
VTDAPSPLRSQYTTNLPQILSELASTLIVTTYQAGKVVLLRNDEGALNTHFRILSKPMGLAIENGRLAIGTSSGVIEYHDVPAAAPRLKPEGKHDAAWIPRRENVTGNVQIHEMAWVTEDPKRDDPPELWFVNTAFSCLATRSNEYSFEPRWRPKWVSALAPGDRCHLNGLAEVDGRVKYVTALGETDTTGGWRENKRDGGLLIDVDSHEIITRGLSMPHSPRWYRDKLWILNSGEGGFGTIDLATGKYEEIAQLDGFTRGLCFAGPLAFIGLSQVRESAVFSGIPLVERLKESESRECGVVAVNIETGNTVGFVRFEDAVQEIFAVGLLAGNRFPDLVHDDPDIVASSYVLPDAALNDVPDDLRADISDQDAS